MKRFLISIFVTLMSVSCGGDNGPGESADNPSIRSEFTEKYEFAMEVFRRSVESAQSKSGNLTHEEYSLIDDSLKELSELRPESGLVVPRTHDNLVTLGHIDEHAAKIERVRIWVVCKTEMVLWAEEILGGEWATPNPSVSYVSNSREFDYQTHPPHYDVELNYISTQTIAVGDLLISPSGCENWPRQVINYKVYSEVTLEHLHNWRKQISEIRVQLDEIDGKTDSVYPYAYVLRSSAEKLEAAYNQLP